MMQDSEERTHYIEVALVIRNKRDVFSYHELKKSLEEGNFKIFPALNHGSRLVIEVTL